MLSSSNCYNHSQPLETKQLGYHNPKFSFYTHLFVFLIWYNQIRDCEEKIEVVNIIFQKMNNIESQTKAMIIRTKAAN